MILMTKSLDCYTKNMFFGPVDLAAQTRFSQESLATEARVSWVYLHFKAETLRDQLH
jgi:hypothetical protein